MAATDLWHVNGNRQEAPPVGPSDREVVEALQRIASAQAHLSLAESQARAAENERSSAEIVQRNREIERAHTELLWAQAGLLSARRTDKIEQEAVAAAAHERAVLNGHGFGSFADYLQQRDETPTTDVHLQLARRESADAQAAWEQLQRAMAPTMIIDLTGDQPRII
jgi:hypothetical protein